jgi:hypothetical protein
MMRLGRRTSLLLVSLLLTSACEGVLDTDYTIRLSGTPGLAYTGGYTTVRAGGGVISQSVEGVVPFEHSARGSIVSVTFQKEATSGRLKIEIIKDGTVAAESETAAEYGVVAVFADADTVDPRGPKGK